MALTNTPQYHQPISTINVGRKSCKRLPAMKVKQQAPSGNEGKAASAFRQ